MTSLHHAHHRTSPPNVKKTAVRAQRPTPLTRSASSRSVAKGSKAKKQADVIVDDEVQDDGMATSFLQFCAMCEKQIIVPNNSILYCSESCRRKDCTPPNYNPFTAITCPSPYPHPHLTPSPHDPLSPHPKPLIPRLQPTVLPAPTTRTSRISSPGPHFTADLDPTEWKPKPASSASTYLALFHSASTPPRSRPTPASTTTTPSLSHTPTSADSHDPSPLGTPADFLPPCAPAPSARDPPAPACGYDKRAACETAAGTARASGGLKTLLAAAVKGRGAG